VESTRDTDSFNKYAELERVVFIASSLGTRGANRGSRTHAKNGLRNINIYWYVAILCVGIPHETSRCPFIRERDR